MGGIQTKNKIITQEIDLQLLKVKPLLLLKYQLLVALNFRNAPPKLNKNLLMQDGPLVS